MVLVSSITQPRNSGHIVLAVIGIAFAFLTSGFVAADTTCNSVAGQRCKVTLPDGIEMSYIETGPTDGQAVLLIHGLTDNLRSWSTTMESLHEINPKLHILAIDLRGHGQSSMPDPAKCASAPEACFRISDFAGDVVEFMSAKGISNATLAGHSLGSFIVQEVALTHPEMVDHAILNATAASGRGNVIVEDYVLKEPIEGSWKTALEAEGKKYPEDVYEMTPLDADPDVETWLAQNWVFDPTAKPAFLEPYLPETASVRLGTWIGATKAVLDYDNTERLKKLSVPTLVMWGSSASCIRGSSERHRAQSSMGGI